MTGFLLDTSVISEITRVTPSRTVVAWLANADESLVYLSAITVAELRYGIERLPMGARRKRLADWFFDELLPRFHGRVLGIDEPVAQAWGQVVHRASVVGRPISIMDAFLAATALVHDLTLVTRNEPDFRAVCGSIHNPWLD